MKHLYALLACSLATPLLPAAAQDLTNVSSLITVPAGASLYVGTGGLSNPAGSALMSAGALRVDGPLTNGGTIDLGPGTLEARADFTNTGTLLPGTSQVSFTGSSDQLLTAGGASLYQVVINKILLVGSASGNTVRLAGDLPVTSGVALSAGLINTLAAGTLSTLRLPAGALLQGEGPGRYVIGSVEITRPAVSGAAVDFGHGAVLDPAGNNLGTVVITRTAGLLTDNVSRGVNFTNSAYKGIDRIWTVVAASAPSAPVQLTLAWIADNDNGLIDFTQARVYGQSAAFQPWALRGPASDASPTGPSPRTVSMRPATLGRFTASNAANPLPVTLTRFTAEREGLAAVRLAWATASEVSNATFTVERSTDGSAFSGIGTVPGAGTSSVAHAYTLLDERLPVGTRLLYYRLLQTDEQGSRSYSPVQSVALDVPAGFAVYPTRAAVGEPVRYCYGGPVETGTLEVFDLLGRRLREVRVDGRPAGQVPLDGLASGSYLLRYTGQQTSLSARCVIE